MSEQEEEFPEDLPDEEDVMLVELPDPGPQSPDTMTLGG